MKASNGSNVGFKRAECRLQNPVLSSRCCLYLVRLQFYVSFPISRFVASHSDKETYLLQFGDIGLYLSFRKTYLLAYLSSAKMAMSIYDFKHFNRLFR